MHSFARVREATLLYRLAAACRAFLLFVACLSVLAGGARAGTWTKVGANAPSVSGGVMLLLSDGTVLCKSMSGGGDMYGNAWNKLTPDSSGSYINGTWTTVAAMTGTRLYFPSQVLKNGRVFVAGGEYGTGGSAGETYDPVANTWTAAPAQAQRISDANSEILPDGRVLVALVNGSLKSTIIFDPVANTWTAGPTCIGIHNESAWVKLPDGSFLMVDRNATTSERYIPSLNQWVADATVPVSLYDPYGLETGGAVLLPDGRAFFIGSPPNTAYYTPSGNNNPGTWAAGPTIPGSRGAPDAPAAMMPNGKILLALSPTPTSANHFPTPTTFYEFDYTGGVNGTFTAINAPGGGTSLNISTYITNMLVLPDGNILYSQQNSSSYYVYSPGGTPLAAGKPTISSITQNGDGSYHLTGTKLNGISEGATYGDDWQMNTNYPIVRLTAGSKVYYARTFNWSSTGVMTGSTPVTTEFTVPASVPTGTYSLVVTANGIASDSVSFTKGSVSSNANLSNLVLSTGTLTPVFASGTLSYTASVGNATASITVTPTVADSTATVKVNGVTVASGTPSGAISLTVGSNIITTVVTAQDGTTTKTYTVTVTRAPSANASLSSLVLSAGTLSPVFASGTTSYTAGVPNATASITVTPTLIDGTATVKVNGTTVASGSASGAIALVVGDNTITTVVTAQNGVTTQSYMVVVTRAPSSNADLSNLVLSAGTLAPAFASGTLNYTASVPNATDTITVTPTLADSTATVSVYEVPVPAGEPSVVVGLAVGPNTIEVEVTAQDGITRKMYTVNVTRAPSSDANLSNLVPSTGTLTPVFASGTLSYTASVGNATTSVTVTPTVSDSTATAKVNGVTVASGTPSGAISLTVGGNLITVTVTAQDGATTVGYSIAVTRRTPYQDWATGFGLSGVGLDPMGDLSGSGLKNVVKWAFDINPASSSLGGIQAVAGVLTAHGVPVLLAVSDGFGHTSYFALFGRRKDAAATGLTYAVEFTADFTAWTASADTPAVVAADSEIEAVTVPFPASVDGLPPRFFRIRVTAQ